MHTYNMAGLFFFSNDWCGNSAVYILRLEGDPGLVDILVLEVRNLYTTKNLGISRSIPGHCKLVCSFHASAGGRSWTIASYSIGIALEAAADLVLGAVGGSA